MSRQINNRPLYKQKQLSDYQKDLIIRGALHDNTQSGFSAKTGIPIATVQRTIQRWRQTGNAFARKRKGRSKILNERDLRHLKNEMKKNRRATLGELTNTMRDTMGNYNSKTTIHRAICRIKMSCRPVFKPQLSNGHKKKRLGFAHHSKKANQRWGHIWGS